ncbi:ABC transporter permease [Hutsoniella sourekii]|uniref:ABC transporter permease n=1 Tax=Hutsoniella sourekii TaxID=87650 RepID=UPI00048277B3|nr:branched-chain amino acid ABC transporter permease [Hutsoniella sourekii]
MQVYLSAIGQGVLWSVMGIGLYISFRILNFADLTSEASFTMGAASGVYLITTGMNPFLATFLAIFAGMFAGWITGFLTTFFEIPGLLSSIISLTGLYSINLRIMGRPNLSLRGFETVYDQLANQLDSALLRQYLLGGLVVLVIILTLNYFFKTDLGQSIIATGDNEVMARSLGIPANQMKRIALMLANGLIALSGALVAQDNGFSDISMGSGTVVVAMSSIVIGEVLFRKQLTLSLRLVSIVFGAIIYRLILVFVLRLGFNPNDFRLVSALVLAVFLAFPTVKRKLTQGQSSHKKGA